MSVKNRRTFFKMGLWMLGALPLLRTLDLMAALAQSCPQGEPKSKKIAKRFINERNKKRLDYFAHWEDAKSHEKYKEGANCDNCSFYKPDKKEPTFGRCVKAAIQYVPSCGWCKDHAFNKKA